MYKLLADSKVGSHQVGHPSSADGCPTWVLGGDHRLLGAAVLDGGDEVVELSTGHGQLVAERVDDLDVALGALHGDRVRAVLGQRQQFGLGEPGHAARHVEVSDAEGPCGGLVAQEEFRTRVGSLFGTG